MTLAVLVKDKMKILYSQMYQQKPRQCNLIANLSKSIAFFTLSAVKPGHFTTITKC